MVNTKYHQWYSSRNGIEDVRYIPDDIYYTKIDQYFNNRKYGWGVNDKNYYGLYFSDVKQPVTVTRKINGIYYNANYEMITKEQAIELCNQASKVIVKPADNSGSRGVDLLKNNDAESLKNAFEYSKSFSRTGESVVEEYMEGSEVSVETMSIDGECHVIQITDKITTGVPYFVEMGHSQPSMLSEKIKGEIAEVAKAANKALGISNGPSHTEIKVTKDGPKIVELGARLGGDNITTHLVPLSTAVNMVECCIRIALREVVDITAKYNKAAAIRYFKTSSGKVKNIIGIHDAELVPGVTQVSIVHGIGEKLKEIKSSTDRAGFVVV